MFCPHCGTRLEEDDGNFCPFCGGSLREDDMVFDGPGDSFYSEPSPASYDIPGNDSCGEPADMPYGAPAQDSYQQPADSSYDAPAQDPYQQPADSPYGAPAQNPYQQPADSPYGAPAQDPYQQPADSSYGVPAQDPYQNPGDGFYSRPQSAAGTQGPGSRPVQNQWVVGRSRSCDIMIHSSMVSRRHCLITRTPDGIFVIEDLGSTNGTYLNGVPLQTPAQLYPGDRIAFADAQFTFQINQGAPALV